MYRPLSPHIFIYKSQWNSIISILHRFTGIYLSLSLLLFIFALKFVIYFMNFHLIYVFSFYMNTFLAWVVISFFFILVYSFFLHILGGLRHIIWDFGYFLTKNSIDIIALGTIFLSLLLTLGFFILTTWL